jgi:hypothetical protein
MNPTIVAEAEKQQNGLFYPQSKWSTLGCGG